MYIGLTKEEVYESRKKYGDNSFSKMKSETFIKKLINTLGDPIIKILLLKSFLLILICIF